MRPYIVATVRNPLNVKATIGFVLYDLNTGELLEVSHEDLRAGVLKKGAVIYNASVKDTTLRVEGIFVDLDSLPYKQSKQSKWNNVDKFLPLLMHKDENITLVRFNGKTIDKIICNKEQLWVYANNDAIILDKDNKLSCDKSNANIVNSPANLDFESGMKLVLGAEKSSQVLRDLQKSNDKLLVGLDEEARDPNVVWDFETFERYMNMQGWDFEQYTGFSGRLISSVSRKCKVLHLPSGTVGSECLFSAKPDELDTIIFNKDFRKINNLYKDEYGGKSNGECLKPLLEATHINRVRDFKASLEPLHINNIYFQKADNIIEETFKGAGLGNLVVTGIAQMPFYKNIDRLYNCCDLNKLDTEGIQSRFARMETCFNKTTIGDMDFDFNLDDIRKSFRVFYTKSTPFKVHFGGNILIINNSFYETNLEEVTFDTCKQITHIDCSFCGSEYLKVLDFRNCDALDRMYELGCDCPNLEQFYLNRRLQGLLGRICDNTKVKRLELGTSIRKIKWPVLENCDGAEVIIPDNISTLDSGLFDGDKTTSAEIVFLGTPKNICGAYYGGTEFQNMKFPKTISEIAKGTFKYLNTPMFDSSLLPNLNYLSEELFISNWYINTVVLDRNIVKLDKNCFKDCHQLETIILSESLTEFSAREFSRIKGNKVPTVYAVKGSTAHKKLNTNTSINLVVVDSIEEARDIVFNSAKTEEIKRAKFDVLLPDTKYSDLLNEPYKKDISFTYKMMMELDANERASDTPALDTRKFRSLPLSQFESFDKMMDRFRKIDCGEDCSNIFIGFSNLITKFLDNCDWCYTEPFIDSMNRLGNPQATRILTCDNKAQIVVVKFNVIKEAYLLAIIVEDVIQFMTPMKMLQSYDINATSFGFEMQLLNALTRPFDDRKRVSIGKYLTPGDFIADQEIEIESPIIINNAKIPIRYYNKFFDNIIGTFKIIGDIDSGKLVTGPSAPSKVHQLLLYDMIDQLIVETKCKVLLSSNTPRIRGFQQINVVRVYTLDEINQIDQKYFKSFPLYCMNRDDKTNNIIKLMSMSKAECDEAYNNKENYDTEGDMNLCYLGELIYQHNITSVDDLIQKPGLLKRVFDTHVYQDAPVSLREIKNKPEVYTKDIVTQLSNGKEFLMQFVAAGSMYVVGTLTGTTPMSSKKVFKYSFISLQGVIRLLYNIGYARSCGVQPKLGITDKNIHEISDFHFLNAIAFNNYNTTGIKVHIAIDKANGDSYLIGEVWDTTYITLFRFKSYFDAMNFITTAKNDKRLENALENLVDCLSYGRDSRFEYTNALMSIRRQIMDGLPNNYPYIDAFPNLVARLAKQPR